MESWILREPGSSCMQGAEGSGAELTELPAFNRLQAACTDFFAGNRPGEDVAEAMDTLDLVLGGTYHRFFEQLPFEESTAELQEIIRLMDQAQTPLRESALGLRAALEEGEPSCIEAALGEMRGHVETLCLALSRWRALQEKQPVCSEAPWVNELVRVARLYLVGRLPLSSFQQRFERFALWHQELQEGLSMLQPAPQERAVVDEARPRIDDALRIQGQAVVELAQFFEDLQESRVEPALQELLRAGAVLVEAQRDIQAAGEKPPTVPCVRCGAENEVTARHCARCQAVLIRTAPEAEMPDARLDMMDSGPARGPVVFENVRRLEDAVAAAGRGDEAGLRELVTELEEKVAAGVDGLKRVKDPPAETPRDQVEVYRKARACLEEGGAEMREGLHLLHQYLESRDPSLLAAGLARYRAGCEPAVEVQAMWEQLQAGQAS